MITIPPSNSESIYSILVNRGYNFWTGVPCSHIKRFLETLEAENEFEDNHVKPANEAQAVGVAFGAWLAGLKPVVYMQECGLPYALNPLATLVIPAKCDDMMLVITRRYSPYQHELLAKAAEGMLQSIGWNMNNVIWVEEHA